MSEPVIDQTQNTQSKANETTDWDDVSFLDEVEPVRFKPALLAICGSIGSFELEKDDYDLICVCGMTHLAC
jgi:hypothetical protein